MPSGKEVAEDVDTVDPDIPVRPSRTSRDSSSPPPKYYQNGGHDTSVTSLPPYPAMDDSGFESPTKQPYHVEEHQSYQHSTKIISPMPKFDNGIDDGLRMPPPPPRKVKHSFNEEFLTVATLCLASAFAFFCCPIFVERPQQ